MIKSCEACRNRSIDGYCGVHGNDGRNGGIRCNRFSPLFGLRVGKACATSIMLHAREQAPVVRCFVAAGRIMKWSKSLVVR